jgi:ZU5 domain
MSLTTRPLARSFCAFALALGAAACGSKSTTPSPSTTSQSIGTAGGTLTLADGASLMIPAGALAATQTITMTSTATVPVGYVGESAFYTFGPAGLQFSMPVEVTLPFRAGSTSPALYWSSSSGTGFDELGGTVAGNTASTNVMHFSSGFVAQAGGPADGGADAAASDGTAGAGGTSGSAGAAGGSAGAASGSAGAAGGAGGVAPDASADGVVPTDAGNGSNPDGGPISCGAAPLDLLTFNGESTNSFRGGITFTSSECVGTSIPKQQDRTTINFTDGVAFWLRGDPTAGYLPYYYPELKAVSTYTDAIGALVWDTTSIAKVHALVPSYDSATMSLISVYTLLNKSGAASPCNLNDGVSYAVPNHPEAVVLYGDLKNGALALGTATEASGGAFITLLPTSALEYVSVVGTKAGCTVLNSGFVFTGRIPIAPGTTSTALTY